MRVRIRLSLRFRGEERIPTEVLAGESRFTVNRVKKIRFSHFDQDVKEEEGMVRFLFMGERECGMKRVEFGKKEVAVFFIMKNDKSVVHITVVHGWFVRGAKQY